MILILDYGMGNVGSIVNMLKKFGEKVIVTADPTAIRQADKLILPGVGAFDMGMTCLKEAGLVEEIHTHVMERQKPLLGICLGMQLLGRSSEEGKLPGLGLLPFYCKRFSFSDENAYLKVPHMGWDRTVLVKSEAPILTGIESPQRYYYVHSYHAICDSTDVVMLTCDYGDTFAAGVWRDNLYGLQFHPEKSHRYGMQLLQNFVERC